MLPVGEGVCEVCHGAPGVRYDGEYFDRCSSCHQTIGQVSRPVELVVPISLYEPRSQLHHVLRNYKDAQRAETRAELRTRAAALLYRFVANHAECIRGASGSDWDVVTSVPSSVNRVGRHPLERAIDMIPGLADLYRAMLRPGPVRVSHRAASDQGFEVVGDVDGESVLLIDDTFTSGARAQSAASALQLAGANVVAMVPIGRYITPDFNEHSHDLWETAREVGFSFHTCCLE